MNPCVKIYVHDSYDLWNVLSFGIFINMLLVF